MKNFKTLPLAIVIAAASGFTMGCNNNPERASAADQDSPALVSAKKDAGVENPSADKASVTPSGETRENPGPNGRARPYDTVLFEGREKTETEQARQDQTQSETQQSQPQPQQARQDRSIDTDKTVLFEFDSAELSDDAKRSLDKMVEGVSDKASVKSVTIEGYADATGSDSYNDQLSQKRAQSVKNYLQQKGIDADSWKVEGRGEENPTASNDDEAGRSENRRVVIQLNGEQNEGLSSSYSAD